MLTVAEISISLSMTQGALVIFIYAGKLSVSLTLKKGIWTLLISRRPRFFPPPFVVKPGVWVKDGQQHQGVGGCV